MADSLGDCAAASEAYKNLDASSKRSLLQVEELSSKEIPVTLRDIYIWRKGARIFMNIEYLVC